MSILLVNENELITLVNFQVMYCDQNCQKIHWFTHKKVCKTLKEIHEKQELEAAKEKRKQEKKQKKG